jgi:hypothetical protein
MEGRPPSATSELSGPDALPASADLGPMLCGDIDIRIGRDGTWFYHGSPIGRKPLVRLFASVLRREADGDYWLVTPVERARIRVDDAPFLAVAMAVHGSGRDQRLEFHSNIDAAVVAGPGHPLRVTVDSDNGEPSPYIMIDAARGLEALVTRAVFYDLVELAEEDAAGTLGVWSAGSFFVLGSAAEGDI